MCGMRTDLYFNKNLRMPEVPTPFQTGDLIHQMLERYYRILKEEGVSLVYSDERFDQVLKECAAWGEEYSSTLSISIEEVDEMIRHFLANVRFHRLDGMIVHEVESVFIFPLLVDDPDLGVFYSGKIDLIATIPERGKTVIDHKTQRRSQEPDPLSNQFTGYAAATGIRNVMINRIGLQKSYKDEQKFTRPSILYTKEQIERWKVNTIWWARQYAFFLEYGEWPENRTSCDKFGGCMFHRLCNAATNEAREFLMGAAYIVGEEWDPTKHLAGNLGVGEK